MSLKLCFLSILLIFVPLLPYPKVPHAGKARKSP